MVFGFLRKVYDRAKVFGKRFVQQVKVAPVEQKSMYPPFVAQALNTYGNYYVSNIRICRRPVPSNTESLINFISNGKWNEAKAKYGFDTFFHLYMLFECAGRTFMLEKNEIINLTHSVRACDEGMPVNGSPTTLRDMLKRTRAYMGDERFFTYDPFRNNCQNFILSVLKANEWNNPELEKFIYQNISQIVDEIPGYVRPVAKALTDIGGVINTALQKSYDNTNGGETQEGTQNSADAS